MWYYLPDWLKWWKEQEQPVPSNEQELLPDPVEK